MRCVVIGIIATLISQEATAANFDDDYSPKCKGEFLKLKEKKITVHAKTASVTSKDIDREVDGMGYVLMVPENSVAYEIKKAGNVKTNQYSLWALFKCKGDKLIHDHCRLGRSVDRMRVNIHPRRYFETSLDNFGSDDGMAYGCHVDDGTQAATEVAEVSASVGASAYMVKHQAEIGCQPVKESNWCGFAPGIVEKGCLDGMDSLQKSKVHSNGYGYIVIDNEKVEKYMQLQVICEYKKFTIQACIPDTFSRPVLKPGECHKREGFAYSCPKQNKGHMFQELSALVKIAPITKGGKVPDELNCFKEVQ